MASRLYAACALAVLLICVTFADARPERCPRGYKTCNAYRKCKTNILCDVKNCGDCGVRCNTTANATPKCQNGSCTFSCKRHFANCDNNTSTGCETNLFTSVDNCGKCGRACEAPVNGTASCVKGRCEVGCEFGLTNCKGQCMDLMSDEENCGRCGLVCPDQPAVENVTDAMPGYCDEGFCMIVDDRCFPGDATVTLEYGEVKQMTELELGDKVAVMKRDGSVVFEDVYVFGRRDASATSQFVRLTLEPIDGVMDHSTIRNLELTSLHFVPISGAGGNLMYKRARDVREGDKMWVHNSGASTNLFTVASISYVTKQGLYDPYTLGGTIIVNGVVASSHSDWFLDDVFQALNLVHWLPSVYQTVLLPVRILYRVLGKDLYVAVYARFDARMDVADHVGRNYGGSVVATFGVASAAAAFLMFRSVSKKAESRW